MGGMRTREIWRFDNQAIGSDQADEQGRNLDGKCNRSDHANGAAVGDEGDAQRTDVAEVFSKGLYPKTDAGGHYKFTGRVEKGTSTGRYEARPVREAFAEASAFFISGRKWKYDTHNIIGCERSYGYIEYSLFDP